MNNPTPIVVNPDDPSTWGTLTPSTQRLNELIGKNPKPRRLTPQEIKLLLQSKHEIAQRARMSFAHTVK